MALNGFSFLLSVVVVRWLPFGHAPQRSQPRRSAYAEAREGVAALRSLPAVGTLILATGVIAVCFAVFAVCQVVYATDVMRMSKPAFAALCAVMSVTMTLGALSRVRTHSPTASRSRYLQRMLALVGGLTLIATAPSLWIVACGYLIAGCGNGQESVHDRLLITELAPDEVRGRVFSLRGSALSWAAACAIAISGALLTSPFSGPAP